MNRTEALMAAFGYQGGTVHDICKEVGLEVNDFLYGESVEYYNDNACGWFAYRTCTLEFNQERAVKEQRKGNLQFWLGVVTAVNCCEKQGLKIEKKF